MREQTASPRERTRKRPADGCAEEMDEKALEVRREMVARFQRQLLEIRASQLHQELRKLDDDIKKVGEQRRRASLAITSYQSAKCASIAKDYSHTRGPLAAIQHPNFSTIGTGSVASGTTIGPKRPIIPRGNKAPVSYPARGNPVPNRVEPRPGSGILSKQNTTRMGRHSPHSDQDHIFKIVRQPISNLPSSCT
jgi:hypothetical protein